VSGWVSLGVLREAVLRLNRAYEALPRGVRTAWWRGFWTGAAALLALTAGLVYAGKAAERAGLLAWEATALGRIMDLPLSFSMAMWLEGPGNGFVLWGVILFAAGVAAWRGRPLVSVALLMGHTFVYVWVAFAWRLWDRARPELLGGIASPGAGWHAYPSGHLLQTASGYGLLFALWIRAAGGAGERAFAAAAYLALLAVVALGRLRIGAHWPSDVAAGALIGAAWAAAVAMALARAERG
jgi:undecaprenyl-diphosphatase